MMNNKIFNLAIALAGVTTACQTGQKENDQ